MMLVEVRSGTASRGFGRDTSGSAGPNRELLTAPHWDQLSCTQYSLDRMYLLGEFGRMAVEKIGMLVCLI